MYEEVGRTLYYNRLESGLRHSPTQGELILITKFGRTLVILKEQLYRLKYEETLYLFMYFIMSFSE